MVPPQSPPARPQGAILTRLPWLLLSPHRRKNKIPSGYPVPSSPSFPKHHLDAARPASPVRPLLGAPFLQQFGRLDKEISCSLATPFAADDSPLSLSRIWPGFVGLTGACFHCLSPP